MGWWSLKPNFGVRCLQEEEDLFIFTDTTNFTTQNSSFVSINIYGPLSGATDLV